MLRSLFVGAIILLGVSFSLRGPFYALLFYLWIAYFRPESWMWYDWVSRLNLSYTVGLYLVAASVLWGARFHLRYRSWLIILFAAFCIISTQLSPYKAFGWPYLQEFLKVFLVSYLITVLVDDAKKLRLTVMVMSLSLGLEAAKQGWAQFILNPGAQNNNTIPFLGDNNGVAIGMLMLVPLFNALSQTAPHQRERWVHRVFSMGVFIRGLTTYSRGAFLSAGTFAIFYALRSKHKIRTVFAIVIVSAIVLPVMPQEFWDRMKTVEANDEGQRDESAQGRLHFWAVGAEMARRNPILGVGFNNFKYAYNDYDFSNGAYGTERASHSTWFGTMGDLGYVGLGLFVVILLSSLWACYRVERIRSDHPEIRAIQPFALALQCSFVVMIVGGTFLHMQYAEMLWHYFALSMALQRIAAEATAPAYAFSTVRGGVPATAAAAATVGAVPAFGRPPVTAFAPARSDDRLR
jgi:probable O-glycosylation ligase (exosortase A-associated)